MAEVSVVTITWNGFIGAPGTTRLAFQPATDAATRQAIVDTTRVFASGLAPFLKTSWSLQVSDVVQNYDLATSILVSESPVANKPPVVAGTVVTSAIYTGGAGLEIKWSTGVVWQGHKVVGRTFVIPAVNVTEADGTLTSTAISAALTASNALVNGSGPKFSIWSKRYDRTVKPPVQTAGALTVVTSASVRDEVAQMRSRRH